MSSYPISNKFREDLVDNGINPEAGPFSIILEAVQAYEHGNADTQDVHQNLTLEAYAAAALDIAIAIRYGGNDQYGVLGYRGKGA